MRTSLAAVLDPFLCLLFPPRCAVCGRGQPAYPPTEARTMCAACIGAIQPVPEPICDRCGQNVIGAQCSHCRKRAPAFARARSLGRYDGVLRAAIHRCKFRDRPQLAAPLGHALAEYAHTQSSTLNGLRFDAVIPVPMHGSRRRQRGYNQAERIAGVVARELEIPLEKNRLRRKGKSRAQVGLTAQQRRDNLHDSFVVPNPDLVKGGVFLVIDDVTTTGSTLHECAKALKDAGAEAVYCLTLAAG